MSAAVLVVVSSAVAPKMRMSSTYQQCGMFCRLSHFLIGFVRRCAHHGLMAHPNGRACIWKALLPILKRIQRCRLGCTWRWWKKFLMSSVMPHANGFFVDGSSCCNVLVSDFHVSTLCLGTWWHWFSALRSVMSLIFPVSFFSLVSVGVHCLVRCVSLSVKGLMACVWRYSWMVSMTGLEAGAVLVFDRSTGIPCIFVLTPLLIACRSSLSVPNACQC